MAIAASTTIAAEAVAEVAEVAEVVVV